MKKDIQQKNAKKSCIAQQVQILQLQIQLEKLQCQWAQPSSGWSPVRFTNCHAGQVITTAWAPSMLRFLSLPLKFLSLLLPAMNIYLHMLPQVLYFWKLIEDMGWLFLLKILGVYPVATLDLHGMPALVFLLVHPQQWVPLDGSFSSSPICCFLNI